MQPDPSHLLEVISLDIPLVGLYDAPDPALFSPLVRPEPGQRTCVFAFAPYAASRHDRVTSLSASLPTTRG
jgi:hypothetical protein